MDFLISRAKKGKVSCQIHLGTASSSGIEGFVEKDSEKAIGWLDTAVQNGCFNPLVFTKTWSVTGSYRKTTQTEKGERFVSQGGPSEKNICTAYLAEMYRCGVEGVVDEDIKEAFEWYKKASGLLKN